MPDLPNVDPGNPLLDVGKALLTAAKVRKPGHPDELASITIRTSSATLTVFLTKDETRSWQRVFGDTADSMSGLVTGNGRPATPPRAVPGG